MRVYSLKDSCLLKADGLLRFLSGHLPASDSRRPNPAESIAQPALSDAEQKKVAGFMRVNYAGEVCAQALYQGQAFTTKNIALKIQLQQAGLEEQDHLYWCQSRLNDLNSHASYLNPFWYAGSLGLGMLAGWFGDEWSLGFLKETENQVVKHLECHLEQLPFQDEKTKIILETMKQEEQSHAQTAENCGARNLPSFVKRMMCWSSKIMTKTAYYV